MRNIFKALLAVCAMSIWSGPSSASVIFSIDSDQTLKGTFSFSGLGLERTTTALLALGLFGVGAVARRRKLN